ncbi:MAG: hypothetical protein Q9170_007887 [Blastenia crenularia]
MDRGAQDNNLPCALNQLQVKPSAWDSDVVVLSNVVDEAGVPGYLTGIVASSLAWIPDDSIREQIWEAASARLSERSGRSAIPSVSRTFTIPASECTEAISVNLHEPSLTADNLGHKTWLASFLLAKRLPSLIPHLPPLARRRRSNKISSIPKINDSCPQVIELGAGTGLVGLAIAALFDVHVHLTDLPAIIPNLRANVADKGLENTSVGELDWSNLPDSQDENLHTYDLVIAADPLYSAEHPTWLVAAIEHVLKQDSTSRVVIELPLREAYVSEVEDLKRRLRGMGLYMEADGQENGFEDWQSAQERNARTETTHYLATQ